MGVDPEVRRRDVTRKVLVAACRKLAGNQCGAACSYVAMTRCRASIDNDAGISANDYSRAAVSFFRAGYLVPHSGYALAMRVRSCSSGDYRTAMAGRISYHDEWPCHHFLQ